MDPMKKHYSHESSVNRSKEQSEFYYSLTLNHHFAF